MITNKYGKLAVFVLLGLIILFSFACNKKSEEVVATTQPAATPVPTTQPAATPAVPAKPVPSFSAAQEVGVYVFPAKNQTHDQQLIDESECYDLAQQQSGVNPSIAPPQPPSQAEIQSAQQQGAASAQQAKGGRVRGAAKGALGGAVIGGIAGDAGKGAAIGATVGTVGGGVKQRKGNEAAKQQAASQAGAQVQQDYKQQRAAYDQQIASFKRAFSACLDARGYSVK